jgi:hypothetical protein
MITVHLIEPDGTRHTVQGHEGQSLMRAATPAASTASPPIAAGA